MTRLPTPLLALLLISCTDAGLQPVPPPPPEVVDNKLTIRGEVCAEPPETTPFPVKILFLLDQSSSLQCTDSGNLRFDALNKVVSDLLPLPNVFMGFIGFASWSRKQGFTRDRGALQPFLDPAQGLGPATDYQGALASAVQLLEQDMIESGAATRARSRYVIVFVSDGSPEPRCRGGCEDSRDACSDGIDNDGDGITDGSDPDCENVGDNALRPDSLYPVCNTDREIEDGTYTDMQGRCPEYNMPRQILQRIDDLRSLETVYSVGDVVLHTLLITSPQAVVEAVCPGAGQQFGYSADLARELLSGMATAGGGTFRDVNVDDSDDTFLEFNFASLTSPFFITEFVAFNQNAVASPTGPVPDSDRDGLGDARESILGTLRHNPDSDGRGDVPADGYRDLFEARFQSKGFDPTSADVPALDCTRRDDTDGDGLLDCEERFLGTDRRLPDSDGDRLVDGLELRAGTDPTVADADRDPDFDGISNRDEVRAGTDPLVADADLYQARSMRYNLDDTGERLIPERESGVLEPRRCYDFELADLELVVTDQPQDRGRNRILLQIFSEPVGVSDAQPVVRQACIEALYPGEGHKDPISGLVDVSAASWSALHRDFEARFKGIESCLDLPPELPLARPDIEGLLERCLPHRIQLGRVLFDRIDLIDLLRRYVRRNLNLRMPIEASDFFYPIELFNPETHCYRPWELARVGLLLDAARDAACGQCGEAGDGGVDGGAGGPGLALDGAAP